MAVATFACLSLAVMADTRVAVAIVLILLVMSLAFRSRAPGWSLLVPMAVFCAWLAVYSFSTIDESELQGDIGLRLSWTFEVLRSSGLDQLLLGGVDLTHANDGAVVAIVNSIGVVGLLLFLYICSGCHLRVLRGAIVTNGALLISQPPRCSEAPCCRSRRRRCLA